MYSLLLLYISYFKLLTQVAVICRCWFCTMNLNLSQAMAMMQKDDMKMGKSWPAFTNLHRYSVCCIGPGKL